MRCSRVTEGDFALLSGQFCVMLYNALGCRSEGILAKSVLKFGFTGVAEITTHADCSGECAETQAGFALQTYFKSFLILTGVNFLILIRGY